MRTAWALMDFGDTLVGAPFDTKDAAEAALQGMSYLGEMLEVREIEFNDEPADERTEELKEQLLQAFGEKEIKNIRLSKGPKFYSMSINERYQYILDIINIDLSACRDIDLSI